jgi:ABC-type multidrug transport system ATPase subunit
VSGLSKSYGGKAALQGVNLTLRPGVYGLLGPNGAGKSTLINIIVGNLTPDAGEVLYDGRNTAALGKTFRGMVGFMPQQQGLYDTFTGYRFLAYIASLKGMPRARAARDIADALRWVNLEDQADKKLGAYSGGMKQRILIAQAVLNQPKILILDEPTAGLDPKERIRVRNMISGIAAEKIVVLATHVVSDVEQIGKEVILLKKGVVLGQAEPRQFMDALHGKVFTFSVAPEALPEVEARYLVSNVVYQAGRLLVRVVSDRPPDVPHSPADPTLEDVYLSRFADEIQAETPAGGGDPG